MATYNLFTYNRHLKRHGDRRLYCVSCNKEPLPPIEMEKHLLTHISSGTSCPWCLGQYTWQPRQKTRHATHLRDCYKRYEGLHNTNPSNVVLKQFKDKVEKCTIRVKCPRCEVTLFPRGMENHVRQVHNGDGSCIWCNGKYKFKDVYHLETCFEAFLQTNQLKESNTVEQGTMDISPMCPEMDMFGRSKLPELPVEAYQHIFLPEWLPCDDKLTFRGNIQLANKYLQMFLQDSVRWYHVMVKAVAFHRFYDVVSKERGDVAILPFWCWCDGGKSKDPMLTHHRHMILITKDVNFMKSRWQNVALPAEERPHANFKSMISKRISTWLHLIYVMGYVSDRSSRCDFQEGNQRGSHHFCIATSLPRCFKACLATQVENGLVTLLENELGKKSVRGFIDKVEKRNGQWCVTLKDVETEMHMVLPVEKHWRPTGNQGAVYMHLAEGKRLHFTYDSSLQSLSEQDWIDLQQESGNKFYSVVGDAWLRPTTSQQKNINLVKDLTRDKDSRIRDMEGKINNLEKENVRLQVKVGHLETDNAQLQVKVGHLETENAQLQAKVGQLEKDNAVLGRNVSYLRKLCTDARLQFKVDTVTNLTANAY